MVIDAHPILASFARVTEQAAYMPGLEGVELRARLADHALALDALLAERLATLAAMADAAGILDAARAAMHGGRVPS